MVLNSGIFLYTGIVASPYGKSGDPIPLNTTREHTNWFTNSIWLPCRQCGLLSSRQCIRGYSHLMLMNKIKIVHHVQLQRRVHTCILSDCWAHHGRTHIEVVPCVTLAICWIFPQWSSILLCIRHGSHTLIITLVRLCEQ